MQAPDYLESSNGTYPTQYVFSPEWLAWVKYLGIDCAIRSCKRVSGVRYALVLYMVVFYR